MKKDLDKLMKKYRINAIFAEGKTSKNATMYYLLNGANLYGLYVKPRGKRPIVVHSALEREVAKQTGHRLMSYNTLSIRAIAEKYKDKIKTQAVVMKKLLDHAKVRGNVVFYGSANMGVGYHKLKYLQKVSRSIKVFYEKETDIVMMARDTKDRNEVERIKKAGRAVVSSFNGMIRTVRCMKVKKNTIMKDKTHALRIGDIKNMLTGSLLRQGYYNSEGMIVSQGRDAGVPHNAGNDRETVKLGKTIVLDIFPQETSGGYFFDFTRTVCFGYAPKHVVAMYRVVKEAQDLVFSNIKIGRLNRSIEAMLCRYFEKNGHPTFLSNAKTHIGYCHSLGHGLGLNVHESPTFGLYRTNRNRITPGQVFTVEPGLYYPDKRFGIRLEDVVYVNSRGRPENLTRCTRKLVIGM